MLETGIFSTYSLRLMLTGNSFNFFKLNNLFLVFSSGGCEPRPLCMLVMSFTPIFLPFFIENIKIEPNNNRMWG